MPDAPRTYTRKVKNAQEAHEAIRPAGETFRTPGVAAPASCAATSCALYDLIWKRTVASQMTDARGQSVSVRIGAATQDGTPTEWAASGRTHHLPRLPAGLRRGVRRPRRPSSRTASRSCRSLTAGDELPEPAIEAKGHTTSPPARYTEASLVKRLEELGIGRPSTYASIMQTIQDRGYVWKKGTALVPTWTAFAVVNLLEQHFGDLVDYSYTARMEDELDEIAARHVEREPWLHRFWFGQDGQRRRPVSR